MINILVVDKHELVGEGIKNILSSEPKFNVELMACSEKAYKVISKKKYEVYIFDLNMPKMNGLELAKNVLVNKPDAKVIILTDSEVSSYINDFIDHGVSGFISKFYSKDQLIRSVWSTIEGQVTIPIALFAQLRLAEYEVELENGKKITLTEKEQEILVEVSKGLSNKETAENVYMSKRNLERNLTTIYKKLRVDSRGEALVRAFELGLIPDVTIYTNSLIETQLER